MLQSGPEKVRLIIISTNSTVEMMFRISVAGVASIDSLDDGVSTTQVAPNVIGRCSRAFRTANEGRRKGRWTTHEVD